MSNTDSMDESNCSEDALQEEQQKFTEDLNQIFQNHFDKKVTENLIPILPNNFEVKDFQTDNFKKTLTRLSHNTEIQINPNCVPDYINKNQEYLKNGNWVGEYEQNLLQCNCYTKNKNQRQNRPIIPSIEINLENWYKQFLKEEGIIEDTKEKKQRQSNRLTTFANLLTLQNETKFNFIRVNKKENENKKENKLIEILCLGCFNFINQNLIQGDHVYPISLIEKRLTQFVNQLQFNEQKEGQINDEVVAQRMRVQQTTQISQQQKIENSEELKTQIQSYPETQDCEFNKFTYFYYFCDSKNLIWLCEHCNRKKGISSIDWFRNNEYYGEEFLNKYEIDYDTIIPRMYLKEDVNKTRIGFAEAMMYHFDDKYIKTLKKQPEIPSKKEEQNQN